MAESWAAATSRKHLFLTLFSDRQKLLRMPTQSNLTVRQTRKRDPPAAQKRDPVSEVPKELNKTADLTLAELRTPCRPVSFLLDFGKL